MSTNSTPKKGEDHTMRAMPPLLDNEESAGREQQGQPYSRSYLTRLQAVNVLFPSAVFALLVQVIVFAITYEIFIRRRGRTMPVCGHACYFYRNMFLIFIFLNLLNLLILIGLAILFTIRGALYFRKKIDLRRCFKNDNVEKTESTSYYFLGILLGSFVGCLSVDIIYGFPVALIPFYGVQVLVFLNYFVIFHVCAWVNEDAGVSLVDDREQEKSWLV
jgi:hypothetical protein